MRFRYLLWDFDGTLFDTYPPLVRAIEHALADLGVTESREEIERLLGITLADCAAVLVERHSLGAEDFEARMERYYSQATIFDKPPFPGALRVCQRVVAAGGRNFIFTHRGRASLFELLEAYGMAGLFADCLAVEDGYPRKPDPSGLITLIEKHALPRAEVLAVGDRDLDILAGQGAGVRTCLFNAQAPPGLQPDYVIAALEELEYILRFEAGGEAGSSP
jgi:phosphoglycolate phosphatase-like HAD superfamily hydrolase